MPLTLDQYAQYLDTRGQTWPAPPKVEPVRAKPHLVRLPDIKAVLWNVYGTLLSISDGQLHFEHPQEYMQNVALEKTLQEFKMWGSMSRKPGQPAEYLKQMYNKVLFDLRAAITGERHPELDAGRVWQEVVKKLMQKDYKFDAGFFGSLNELGRKVAFFFHASSQGTAAYPGAAEAMRAVADAGLSQGLLGDGQCFTPTQLGRALAAQDADIDLDTLATPPLRVLSYQHLVRKPGEALFEKALEALEALDIAPGEVLHVGSSLPRDLAPAKRAGMRTALFAGDKGSLVATPEMLKEPGSRPDVLLTELAQIAQVVSR